MDVLHYPNGMCISPNNEFIFITDVNAGVGTCRICVLNTIDGTYVRSIEGPPGNILVSPSEICISPSGDDLFVTEGLSQIDEDGIMSYSTKVKVFNAMDGTFKRTIESPGRKTDICISEDGELLFLTDFSKHQIQVLRSSDGALLQTIGNERLRHPNSICLSQEGELYVTDGSNAIKVFRATDGSYVRSIGIGRRSSIIRISPFGDLFVSHPNYNRDIEVFRKDGTPTRTISQTAYSRGLCASNTDEFFTITKNTQTGKYCVKVFQN
jgi:sugar lactone lactonase YvrE